LVNYVVDGLLEQYGSRNPFELCDFLDIKIFVHPLGKRINGFYQRTEDGIEVIHINSSIDDSKKKYICAHELGHALLHTDLNIHFLLEHTLAVKNKYELAADKFAALLLIHDDLLKQYPEYYNLEQVAASESLPLELLKLKFEI